MVDDQIHYSLCSKRSLLGMRDRLAMCVGKSCLDCMVDPKHAVSLERASPLFPPFAVNLETIKKVLFMDSQEIDLVLAAIWIDIAYAVIMHEGTAYIRRRTVHDPEFRIAAICDLYTVVRDSYLAASSSMKFKMVDVEKMKTLARKDGEISSIKAGLAAIFEQTRTELEQTRTDKVSKPETSEIWDLVRVAVRETWLQILVQQEDQDEELNYGSIMSAFSLAGYDSSVLMPGIMPNICYMRRHARIFKKMVYSHVDYRRPMLEKEYKLALDKMKNMHMD